MSTSAEHIDALVIREYKEGFVPELASDSLPPGLDEGVIRALSRIKGDPPFMLEWRLDAYARWLKMTEPKWAQVRYSPVDLQAINY